MSKSPLYHLYYVSSYGPFDEYFMDLWLLTSRISTLKDEGVKTFTIHAQEVTTDGLHEER